MLVGLFCMYRLRGRGRLIFAFVIDVSAPICSHCLASLKEEEEDEEEEEDLCFCNRCICFHLLSLLSEPVCVSRSFLSPYLVSFVCVSGSLLYVLVGLFCMC